MGLTLRRGAFEVFAFIDGWTFVGTKKAQVSSLRAPFPKRFQNTKGAGLKPTPFFTLYFQYSKLHRGSRPTFQKYIRRRINCLRENEWF
jgi:hypothetical protein